MSAGSEHPASAAPRVVPAACAWKVGPRLSCRHLLDRDPLTKSDPSVALLMRSQGQWVQVGWARAGLRGAQEPRWAREASGAQGRGVQALRERGTGRTACGSGREALQVGGAPGREGRSSEGATQDPVPGSRATEKHSSLRVWAGGLTKGSRREWGYRAWYSSASLPSWEPGNREGRLSPAGPSGSRDTTRIWGAPSLGLPSLCCLAPLVLANWSVSLQERSGAHPDPVTWPVHRVAGLGQLQLHSCALRGPGSGRACLGCELLSLTPSGPGSGSP